MNDLQKDQAIYQAMCEIAEKYFNRAIKGNENFRKFMAEKTNITAKELQKCSKWDDAVYYSKNFQWDKETINVDSFSCSFNGDALFVKGLLETFRSLAKVKTPYVFTYEEEIINEYIGSVDIAFDNPANAKTLAEYVCKEDYYPSLCDVLLEVNATTGDISFVSCDKFSLGVITNDKRSIDRKIEDNDNVFQALFTAADWKKICDYAKKSKSSVKFEIYKAGDNEKQDTMVAHLSDTKIKSVQESRSYPNWRSVLQKNADKHFAIHPDDAKDAQSFIQKLKGYNKGKGVVSVSFYRGSELVYFDYFDRDSDTTKTASFRLTKSSSVTIGLQIKISILRKMKFFGFNIEDEAHGVVIDCKEVDYMLVMPVFDANYQIPHIEEREVVEELATVA